MKHNRLFVHRFMAGLIAVAALSGLHALAFPPAPHHVIYGSLRDEMGTPFAPGQARVFLQHEDGIMLEGVVDGNTAPGINYSIVIPMDSGTTLGAYRPTAMKPLARFKIWVRLGNTLYLPIQMQGDLRTLGQPAQRTRIDLTMGVDSDGDGIPDAYKDLILAMLGDASLSRADIRPDSDLLGTGMTVWQHYISGTYPWDPNERVDLAMVDVADDQPVVAFTTIPGRTYLIEASYDLIEWTPVNYRFPESPEISRAFHVADSYREGRRAIVDVTRSSAPQEDNEEPARPLMFRLGVR